ncbi:hypothetical protein [Pseudomonas viridiflava]|uniref:hypothetical protein n=1 Tax=Pseudomonas syringae group TaxID=136849 RepID=UPI0013CE838E|nr:hypothetical protein [Pseudomonas viridiflava]
MYTFNARRVLSDVEVVREKLEDETGFIEWRLQWVTAIVLIRAVGHVLNKVDGNVTPIVRTLASELHRRWKTGGENDAIFRDFIEQERNSILKEYEFGMSEGPVPVSVTMVHAVTGELFEQRAAIGENVYRPMWSGPYEGEDGRTLLDEAISWWRVQLDWIDSESAMRLDFSAPSQEKK